MLLKSRFYVPRPVGYTYEREAQIMVAACRIAFMQRLAEIADHLVIAWHQVFEEMRPGADTIRDHFAEFIPVVVWLEDNHWLGFEGDQFYYRLDRRAIKMFRDHPLDQLDTAFRRQMAAEDNIIRVVNEVGRLQDG